MSAFKTNSYLTDLSECNGPRTDKFGKCNGPSIANEGYFDEERCGEDIEVELDDDDDTECIIYDFAEAGDFFEFRSFLEYINNSDDF